MTINTPGPKELERVWAMLNKERDESKEAMSVIAGLLTLLDLIEVKEDSNLAWQRFAILDKYPGFSVVFEGPASEGVH